MAVVPGNSEPLAFDELGWRQFSDLCATMLEIDAGVDAGAWIGEGDRRWRVTLPGGLRVGPGAELGGPCRVEAIWISDRGVLSRSAGLSAMLSELRAGLGDWAGSVAVISNYAGVFSDRERLQEFLGVRDVVLLGPGWLSARVDGSPRLRRAMPSLLSLGALDRWVSVGERAGSTLNVGVARALGDVFVPTWAYRRALTVLDEHQFAVLTGPPEMGKTAIAQMIALALMTDGWQAFECTAPEEIFAAFDAKQAQVFVADDAFGSTEYRPEAAENWAREMERLLRMMDERHRLIWTSRPAPLRAGLDRVHRQGATGRFPRPGEVLVDASRLSLDEKALILLRHAKANVSPELRSRFRTVGYAIVSNEHFTPERIRRLVATDAAAITGDVLRLERLVERHIQAPTEAMASSFAALSLEHQALLFALLDAPPGPVEERQVAQLARAHYPQGLSQPAVQLLDRLTDHFLRVSAALKVSWVHPSWRDLVIDHLSRDSHARGRFLERCTIEGVLLAISVAGGPSGDRTLALMVEDRDWDLVTDRIAHAMREASDRDATRLLDALATAVEHADDQSEPEVREARALANVTLEAAARRCDRQSQPIELELIRAWFAVARQLPEKPAPPRLDKTWTELLPSDALDLRTPGDFDQALAWLDLADVLIENAPAQLMSYGFPDQHTQRIETLMSQAESLVADQPTTINRDRLTRLLRLCRRYGSFTPPVQTRFDQMIWQIASDPDPDPPAESFHQDDSSIRDYVEGILEDL